MGFVDSLNYVTGLEKSRDGGVELIDGNVYGEVVFLNSWRGLTRKLEEDKLDFESELPRDVDPTTIFSPGKRLMISNLNMPKGCVQGPHCHPGGEFAYVKEGEYYDAFMDGRPRRIYPQGSTVFYRSGSTHRPLSGTGAKIVYIAFDGIIFGENPEKLAEKMVKARTSQEAIEYATTWMVEDKEERKKLMDKITTLKSLAI